MKDRRKHKRIYLMLSTRVFNQETGKVLGNLANLSSEGAMIIGESRLEVGKVYRLYMNLSKSVFSKNRLEFEASCIWSKPGRIAPQYCETGLQFVKINPKDLEIMTQIIKEYQLQV